MVGYTDLMELRSMSGKEHWQSADFEKIMIATVLSGEERIRHTPQSINMDCWSKLRRDVRQVTAETGSEQWVGFYIDRQKKVFNIPPSRFTSYMGNQIIQTDNVESEELHYIEAGWDHPSGDSGRYVPIGGIHSHIGSEKDPRTQNPTASNRDLLSFVGDDCQLFMLIELHGKLFLALKTNSTPRNLDPKTLQRRIGSLTEEFASSGSKVPIIDEDRLRFNQQIALEYGLSLYQSSDAEPDLLKRLPLFYS